MDTSQVHEVFNLITIAASGFCLGCLLGAWVQSKRSQADAELLVGMWERLHFILDKSQDNERYCEQLNEALHAADERQRKYKSELLLLKRDVDALYNIDAEEEITLDIPLPENSAD